MENQNGKKNHFEIKMNSNMASHFGVCPNHIFFQ